MENFIGVIIWLVILLIYFINKNTKKTNKPSVNLSQTNTEGKLSKLIQELANTQKQSYENIYGDDEVGSLEVIKPEIRPKQQKLPETYKSRVAQDNVEKDISSNKKQNTEISNEYQEFIQDPDNLRKAFILKEIFDRKF